MRSAGFVPSIRPVVLSSREAIAGKAHGGISIGLLGDVMLGRGVGYELARRPPEQIWDAGLRALAGSLDLLICNLECCLSERGRPTDRIPGKPFFFRGPPGAVDALRAIGVGAVTVANNHALDFGEEALEDTIALLDRAGIAAAGAGPGVDRAHATAVMSAAGRQVALVAVTDHPRQYAVTPGRPGVAYARLRDGIPDWMLRRISDARARGHLVVTFPHWGPNMTTRPAPWQRERAAELLAAGAHLVAGHSAHVFHGAQWTSHGPVLYDLGDALDDYAVDPILRNDLGILAVWRPDRGDGGLQLTGLRLTYAQTGLATGADAQWIYLRLREACGALGTGVERISENTFRVCPG